MRMEDVNARKAYIKRVRQSFDAPGRGYEFEKSPDVKEEGPNEFLFVKLRFLAAALIFAAYIFCDRAGVKIYRYSTGEVAEKIAKGYDYSEAREEVMQGFRALEPGLHLEQ